MHLAEYMIPRLKAFRKTTISHPPMMTMKKWRKILKKIIKALQLILEDDYTAKSIKQQRKGLKLLGRYFNHLWI
jgi:hypothetical protein